jgi:hypothetical protein
MFLPVCLCFHGCFVKTGAACKAACGFPTLFFSLSSLFRRVVQGLFGWITVFFKKRWNPYHRIKYTSVLSYKKKPQGGEGRITPVCETLDSNFTVRNPKVTAEFAVFCSDPNKAYV